MSRFFSPSSILSFFFLPSSMSVSFPLSLLFPISLIYRPSSSMFSLFVLYFSNIHHTLFSYIFSLSVYLSLFFPFSLIRLSSSDCFYLTRVLTPFILLSLRSYQIKINTSHIDVLRTGGGSTNFAF